MYWAQTFSTYASSKLCEFVYLDHLDMDEEEGDEATGEDDDDPAVEDGDVLHDGQVRQGEVWSICGDASKVGQVVHLANMMTFA